MPGYVILPNYSHPSPFTKIFTSGPAKKFVTFPNAGSPGENRYWTHFTLYKPVKTWQLVWLPGPEECQ